MTTAMHQPIRLAGRTLARTRHICAFFHSDEERERLLGPFFKEGYDRGEKIYHIVDGRQRGRHLAHCAACGIDVAGAEASGQLEVRTWDEAYLRDGYFDGDRMVQFLSGVLESSREKFGLTRLMGLMEWALETVPGVTDIIEYETKLNLVLPNFPAATTSTSTAAAS
jgi:hypothetical protein